MDHQQRTPRLAWIAAAALIAAAAALAVGIVALSKTADSTRPTAVHSMGSMTSGSAMSGMSSDDAKHMQPLPMDGIKTATATRGGVPLRGVMRNGVEEFSLDARPVWWQVTSKQRLAAWAYNGLVPGPQIRVRNGQRVRIAFTNHLPEATTVHWHGIGVPNSQDGVPGVTQQAIEPGGKFTYEFTARPAGDPRGGGTFLYHSHVDEDRQMSVGLSGSLIIDPPRPPVDKPAVEKTLLISEWTADAGSGRTRGAMQMDGMWPNFFTINGKSWPDTERIDVPAGKRVLFRLINAGQFAHPLHLHGTAFRVIARDGHPVDDPGLRDTLTLESGERADITFALPKGKWVFHCHIGHHLTNDGNGPGGLLSLVTAT